MPDLTWKKSSYSGQGNCIEVAHGVDRVWIRDSNEPNQFVTVTREDWEAFVAGVKAGEFDQDSPASL